MANSIQKQLENVIIKNNNGRMYMVIEKKGDYSLVKDLDREEYVTVSNLQQCRNGLYEWGFGHYFSNLQSAIKDLYQR